MTHYDLILRGGMIYDGSGKPPIRGDVAINADRITAVGDIGTATADREIQLNGLGSRSRIHQHAQLVSRVLSKMGVRKKRNPAGRDLGSHGRRHVDGADEVLP